MNSDWRSWSPSAGHVRWIAGPDIEARKPRPRHLLPYQQFSGQGMRSNIPQLRPSVSCTDARFQTAL